MDVGTNKLVRLVADEKGEQIKKDDFKVSKNEVQIGDKIEIEYTPAPLKIQTENIILNKVNKVIEHCDFDTIDKIMSSASNNGDLLKTQEYAIPHNDSSNYNKSLMVAEVSDFKIEIIKNDKEKPKTKASFLYNNKQYDKVSVTDTDYFQIRQVHKKCKIILSVPEIQYPKDDDKGKHFKIIAKVFLIQDDDNKKK